MKNPISVLVLEQSQVFSRYLALLLQSMGLKSLCVREPEAAKTVLSRNFSDVLIVGDGNGSQQTHAIVQDLSNCITDNSIPIIVVSSCADQDAQKECFEAGCHAYLTKPIQPKLLHDALYNKVFPFKERRKSLRSKVDLKAEFSVDKQQSETLDLVSLSKNGCLISSQRIVTTGTKVKLILSLAKLQIPVSGTVLYTLTRKKGSDYISLGVLFHNVNQIHADMIEQYLEMILDQENLLSKASKGIDSTLV